MFLDSKHPTFWIICPTSHIGGYRHEIQKHPDLNGIRFVTVILFKDWRQRLLSGYGVDSNTGAGLSGKGTCLCFHYATHRFLFVGICNIVTGCGVSPEGRCWARLRRIFGGSARMENLPRRRKTIGGGKGVLWECR